MKAAKFDIDFVNRLIDLKEGEKFDFKQKITSREKIAKTLAALANTEGGCLLIGVSDAKKIIGIDPEEERYMIDAANEEFCFPTVSLSFRTLKVCDEKPAEQTEQIERLLLLVTVEKTEGNKVFCKNKNGELKSYKRVNDQTKGDSV